MEGMGEGRKGKCVNEMRQRNSFRVSLRFL
jgi:hypothetical protein